MKHILRILLLINLLLAITYKVSASENDIYWAIDKVDNNYYSLTLSSKEIEGTHYHKGIFDSSVYTEKAPWRNDASTIQYVKNIYIGGDNDIVKPAYMYNWFYNMRSLEEIDLTYLDTSSVVNMAGLFMDCSNLKSLDLSNFNTSNVTSMENMFSGCSGLTSLDLNSFNTSNVTNMTAMFSRCSELETLNVSSFNTSNVTNMDYMFQNCSKLTSLSINNFNTSKVIKMNGMFGNCNSLETLDISNFDTSKVTNMDYMFGGCSKLSSLDVSNLNTSNVISMKSMFSNCSRLTSLDISNFDTSNVTKMGYMFGGCSKLTSLDLSNFNTSKVTDMVQMFAGCSKLTSLDLRNFNTSKVTNMAAMFGDCNDLTTLDIKNFDTSNVTNMANMFSNCNSLKTLDLSNFNTSKVTNMGDMFSNCSGLTSLDISSFDTSNVTNMQYMFNDDYRLQVIRVSESWNTIKVTNSYKIFGMCNSLIGMNGTTLLDGSDISYARIDAKNNPGLLWDHIPSTLYTTIKWAIDGEYSSSCTSDIGNCKLTLSTNEISGNHRDSGEFLYMSGSPWHSYHKYINEIQIGGPNDIIKPYKTMRSWFDSLFSIDLLDLTYLDTSNVEDMSELFLESSIRVIVVSDRWDTSKVNNSGSMFQTTCNPIIGQYGTKYDETKTDITYAKVDTKDNPGYLWNHVPNKIYWAVDGSFCEEQQGECTLKISSKEIPGNHYSTGYVTELEPYEIPKLYSIKKIIVGGENDIVSIMSANSLLSGYTYVKEIDFAHLDTSRVRDMHGMFANNESLEKVDLSSLNLEKVTDMSFMFNGCYQLKEVKFGNSNSKNLTNMSTMFQNDYNLVDIDFGTLDTSNVTNMSHMFNSTHKLKYLDLRIFDTKNVENMDYMFYNADGLEQVAVSNKWNTSKVTSSDSMFNGCNKIKGKNGTTRTGAANELIYARIDTENNPGYFTDEIDRSIFSLDAPVIEFTEGKDGEINLRFNNVQDAMGYNLYRKGIYYWSDINGGTWTKIATLTDTNEYLDKDVTVDYYYSYKVTAFNNGGESPYSNEISKHIEKPNKVQNLQVIKGSKNSIKISWDKEPYQGYYVYMGTSKDNMKRVAVIKKASQNYYEAKNLKENKKYYFKVKAFAIVKDAWFFSSNSDVLEARTSPKTPSISVKNNSYNSLKVVINKQNGATYYVIQRSTNAKKDFKTIVTVEDLNYIDLDLISNTKYYYKVKACNQYNICSSYTKAIEGKPTLKKPSVTLKTSSKKVTITLRRINDADGYVIYRATKKNGKYSKIATLLSEEEVLSYIDKTKKGKTYYYKVRAYKIINDSRVYGPYTGIKSIKSK